MKNIIKIKKKKINFNKRKKERNRLSFQSIQIEMAKKAIQQQRTSLAHLHSTFA